MLIISHAAYLCTLVKIMHNYDMKVHEWLALATSELTKSGIKTGQLDAELILGHTLRHPKTWLHAHTDDEIEDRLRDIATARLDLRLDRVPIAYIIGHKEFYGRRFAVSPATLIPRPESESLIELLTTLVQPTSDAARLVDVGTGSGILGITAKLEHPALQVTLTDISKQALTIAEKNATLLGADVTLLKSNLLQQYPYKATIILANLPYVDRSWERSPETAHEPESALFADDNGTALIKQLIVQAPSHITKNGYLILEADPVQHHILIDYAAKYGFTPHKSQGYAVVLQYNP